NIRALNFYNDRDDVVRRVPLTFDVDGERTTSMSVELASRALGAVPEIAADGTMTLAGYRIPSRVPNTLALNFEGGRDIPTFSLADLRACAEKNDVEYFRRYFAGKVVIFGTVLDVEDRHITSKRFATLAGTEGAQMPRCTLPVSFAGGKFVRDSISGVYGHATAVNNLIRREALVEFGGLGSGVAAAMASAFAAVAALLLAPGATRNVVGIRGGRRAAAGAGCGHHGLCRPGGHLGCCRDRGISSRRRAALGRSAGHRFCRACSDDRLPFRRRRQGQEIPPQELRALSRPRHHREDDGIRAPS